MRDIHFTYVQRGAQIHSSHAHTTEVASEDEEQDEGAKDDGDDERLLFLLVFCMNFVSHLVVFNYALLLNYALDLSCYVEQVIF
jgi:hypothetical protein